MVTSAERLVVVQEQLKTLSPEERERVIFVQPSKDPKVTGVRIIDKKTGELKGSVFTGDFPKKMFRVIESPEILVSRRRSEEKKITQELAQQEAEFEAKRIAEGKVKAKDVILTQRGSKVILTRLLQAQAQKKLRERLQAPPTREERIRAVERKQRIVSVLKRQEAARREAERLKAPLELFSEKAIKQLGLGETAEGLLTITLRKEEEALKIPEKKMLPFKITFDSKIDQKRRDELERIVRRKFSEQPSLFRATKGIEFVSGVLTSDRGIKALGIADLNVDTFRIAVIPGRPETIAPTITHEATHLIVPNLVSKVLPDRFEEFISERATKKEIPGRIGEAPLIPELEAPGRKLVVQRGKILADIPVSAEFRTGFEKFVGKGFKEEDLFGLKTTGGVLTFKTIERPIVQLFEPSFKQQKELEQQIKRELRVTKDPTRRFFLRQRQIGLGIRRGILTQIGEQPIETGGIFVAGALVGGGLVFTGLAKVKGIGLIAKGLGTLFVGATAIEAGLELREKDFLGFGKVLGERATEAGLFITGGKIASRVIQAVRPSRVKVLKAKELESQFAETLETEGTSAKSLQRIGLQTEVKIRVAKVKAKTQIRQLKTPKDPQKLLKLLEDPDVRFELRFNPKTGQVEQVLVREIRVKGFRPKIQPDPFEIVIKDGKVATRVRTQFGDIEVIRDIRDVKLDLKRVIDPTTFKRITGRKGFTILQKDVTFDIDKLRFDFRAELGGEALITGKVKRVAIPSDIFGIGQQLLPPELVFQPTTTITGFKPILAVSPLIQPTPLLVFPTGIFGLFGRARRRVREPILDVTRDISRISKITPATISESISKRDVISDIAQIAEQVREGRRITGPVIDVGVIEEQLPIVDVVPKRKQEQIVEQISKRPPTQDIALLTGIPIRRKPKKIIKGKFEGYNAFVKGRKRQLKVNLRRTLTKQSALSSSARVVDNSIAATGSIKKVISNRPPLDTKDKYFQRNRDKFRTFRIRKGKRIPLKDKFIELRGKRLDTRGEVLQISAARKIAEQRKRLAKLDVLGTQPRRRRTVRFF